MNEQMFRAFYQEHLKSVYRYIYGKVGNREEAEDLTTQVFLKVLHQLDFERDARSMQKWLFQVARTTVADYWRVQYRLSTASLDTLLDAGWEGPVQEESEQSSYASMTPVERVQVILLALPDHYREVLTCRFLLNLSIKETALKLGLTEANVKVLQFRALKRAAEMEVLATEDTLKNRVIPSERDYAR